MVLRSEETTHRQSKTCLSVPSHTGPEQHRDCLGPVNGKRGFFFDLSPTPATVLYLFPPILTKETEHTSSWPLISRLPWVKPRKGRRFFSNLHFMVWHVIAWSWRRLASFSDVGHTVLDQQREAEPDCTDKCLHFWLQLEHLTQRHLHQLCQISFYYKISWSSKPKVRTEKTACRNKKYKTFVKRGGHTPKGRHE